MAYRDHTLGQTVEEVLRAFYNHPGQMDKKPFGFDVHQGFEFAIDANNNLYKLVDGGQVPVTSAEEERIYENLSQGAVEFYLKRPAVRIVPLNPPREILHAATGKSLPKEE